MKFDKSEKTIVVLILIIAILLTAIVLVLFWLKGNEKPMGTGEPASFYQTTRLEDTMKSQEEIFQNGDSLGDVTNIESVSTEKNPQIKVPESKNALIDEYNKALNSLKKSSDFKVNMTSSMNIQINEITGGKIAERIVQGFVNDTNNSVLYNFKNGQDSVSGKSPNSVMPPANQSANLQYNHVLFAKVLSSSVDGYTVRFILADETVTTGETPKNHLICLPELSMNMDESSLSINNYNVLFTGSTITAKYDSQGRLICIENITRSSNMVCDGSASFVSLHVSMCGNIMTTYNIMY